MTEPKEFEIIQRFFKPLDQLVNSVSLSVGGGDDAAVMQTPDGMELVFSIDTQLPGVHFPEDSEAELIAGRALACALSDLCAMGATPECFTLALTIPECDEGWLEAFAKGLSTVARRYQCNLAGGDTTRGPLAITIQVHGLVPDGQAIMRAGSGVGDVILVSGFLGGAAAFIYSQQQEVSMDAHALELFSGDFWAPELPVTLGAALRGRASAALDISDGLIADLGHLCEASGCRARIELESLPVRPELKNVFSAHEAWSLAATGGDDYGLCFTVPSEGLRDIVKLAEDMETPVTVIGEMIDAAEAVNVSEGREVLVQCIDGDGNDVDESFTNGGYQHF
jgi:thiamine-monophosphate kinase